MQEVIHSPERQVSASTFSPVAIHVKVITKPKQLEHEREQLTQQVVQPVRLGPPLGSRLLYLHDLCGASSAFHCSAFTAVQIHCGAYGVPYLGATPFRLMKHPCTCTRNLSLD